MSKLTSDQIDEQRHLRSIPERERRPFTIAEMQRLEQLYAIESSPSSGDPPPGNGGPGAPAQNEKGHTT